MSQSDSLVFAQRAVVVVVSCVLIYPFVVGYRYLLGPQGSSVFDILKRYNWEMEGPQTTLIREIYVAE